VVETDRGVSTNCFEILLIELSRFNPFLKDLVPRQYPQSLGHLLQPLPSLRNSQPVSYGDNRPWMAREG
jgi:hypothetical protein